MTKLRLDQLLLDRELVQTKDQAIGLIMAGQVLVNDQKVDKCGQITDATALIRLLKQPNQFVSRGAEKLVGAHQQFGFNIQGRVALDVGISTGGFTDYLLQNQAAFVFGVDVSYGLLSLKLRQDSRLAILERTNARYLTKEMLSQAVGQVDIRGYLDKIDLVVMDTSFISVTKILPQLKSLVLPSTDFIVLIKPQFEAEKSQVGPGGLIKDNQVRYEIAAGVEKKLVAQGFKLQQKGVSPILGTKGNEEFFFWLQSV